MAQSLRNVKTWLTLLFLPLLVAGLGVAGISIVKAVTVGGGTIGGFEADGNQVVDTAGNIDWASTTKPPRVDVVDDTLDSGFTEGSKELKPSGWVCGTGGANPDKGNILRAYVNPRIDANGAFLDLAWVREGVSGQGDVHVNFEFNQQFTAQGAFAAGNCPITRVANDLLITYDFPGGNGAPTIRAFRWTPLAVPTSSADGDWTEVALSSSDVAAAVNQASITDSLSGGGSIDTQRFG